MKKILLFVVLPLFTMAAVAFFLLALQKEQPEVVAEGYTIDSLLTELPQDAKKAEKELTTARKALEKLTPAKPYIVIDTHANRIYMRTKDKILLDARCSTGSGGELIDSITGRKWIFNTPRGIFKIRRKVTEPWWRKPDWAFIEEGEEVPKKESERLDPNVMGDYALDFGDGFFIHGTIYERLLGVNVTHGCVRLGSEDLDSLYKQTPIGTYVYIF
jgi:lipoprotein-anchoring transpeptidase ErfK/SrfK